MMFTLQQEYPSSSSTALDHFPLQYHQAHAQPTDDQNDNHLTECHDNDDGLHGEHEGGNNIDDTLSYNSATIVLVICITSMKV